ncbi:MAG: right-handed parallel beta-helix repeat-containing protein, partial [Planctomycetota bacterium]
MATQKNDPFSRILIVLALVACTSGALSAQVRDLNRETRERAFKPVVTAEGRAPEALITQGEAAVEKITRISTSSFGAGEPVFKSRCRRMGFEEPEWQTMRPPSQTNRIDYYYWGADRRVRNPSVDNYEFNQSMATDSQGNLYVAWEDNSMYYNYIKIYKSENYGLDWTSFAYINDISASLREPSIAVGEGGENCLIVAYIVDDGGMKVPEIAVSPLDSADFTFYSLTVWSWEDYGKPVICTDTVDYNAWYAYLTCEGIVNSSTGNINVCAWRGTDYGTDWNHDIIVMGGSDSDSWVDPDIAYGTSDKRVFIVAYKEQSYRVYLAMSGGSGSSYGSPFSIASLYYYRPEHAPDPEIAVARSLDTALVCFTADEGVPYYADFIRCVRSEDAGETWSGHSAVGSPHYDDDAFAVALCADEQNKEFHVAYTCNSNVFYNRCSQNFNKDWLEGRTVVSDSDKASNALPKKGIVCPSGSSMCCMAWSDYRDGPTDYATFFDSEGNSKIYYVPKEFPAIQEAINAIPDYPYGYDVRVARGTYYENIDFNGKQIDVESEDGAMLTVIDGNQTNSVVTFDNHEFDSTSIRGFTLRNGLAFGGGGVHYENDSLAKVVNCIITDHTAVFGGGVYSYDDDWSWSQPELLNVTIYGNTALIAGGAFCSDKESHPVLYNSILWGNSAPTDPEIS